MVKRGACKKTLDHELKKQALGVGVDINFNSKKQLKDVDVVSTGPSGYNDKINIIAKGIKFETNFENIGVSLVNNETSVDGYSYLLVKNGHGCISTVCFHGFENIDICFQNTIDTFMKLFDLDVKNKKNFGGIGFFDFNWRLQIDNKIFTGEAAGLQDFLWGFGMRYAITSGFLAAESIIKNQSYKKLIKKHLYGKLKASLINRYYAEKSENFGKFLLTKSKQLEKGEHHNFLYFAYNMTPLKKIIYPFAKYSIKKKY